MCCGAAACLHDTLIPSLYCTTCSLLGVALAGAPTTHDPAYHESRGRQAGTEDSILVRISPCSIGVAGWIACLF